MRLARLITKLEDVKEAFRELYVKQDDGTYLLEEADDGTYKTKLDEFRTTNRNYFQQLETSRAEAAKWKGKDPAKYEEALEALAELDKTEEAELIKKGKFNDVVEKRVAAAAAEYERAAKAKDLALTEKQTELNDLRTTLGRSLRDVQVQKWVGGVGVVRKKALDDILSRGQRFWDFDAKGTLIPKVNGEVVYGKGGNPMTGEEWAAKLLEEAPHLFESGKGSGAEGGEPGVGEGGNVRRININDPVAFGRNAEAIAKGEVLV